MFDYPSKPLKIGNYYIFFVCFRYFILEDSLPFLYKYLLYNKNFYKYLLYNIKNFLKFYYIFYYLVILYDDNVFIDPWVIVDLFWDYFLDNMNKYLKIKDNLLLIILECLNENIHVEIIDYNFFYKKKKFRIILPNEFLFQLDFLFFLLYKEYMDYVRKFTYNEYLDTNETLLQYPLLKVLLRFVCYNRLDKIHDRRTRFITDFGVFDRFQIISDVETEHLQTESEPLLLAVENINSFSKCLLPKGMFTFIDFFNHNFCGLFGKEFKKFLLIYYLYPNFFLNLFHWEEDDWVEVYRDKVLGLYNMYLHMRFFGFELDLFTFFNRLNSLKKTYMSLKIHSFNNYNLNYIINQPYKIDYLAIFWYKILKFVLLEQIHTMFFKLVFFIKNIDYFHFRSGVNRIFWFWVRIIRTHTFFFLPINYLVYYDKNLLSKYLNNIKYSFDYITFHIYNTSSVDYRDHYNYDTSLIIKKITNDNILKKNFKSWLGVFYYYCMLKYGRLKIIDYLLYYICLRDLIIKINGDLIWNNILIDYKILNNLKLNLLFSQKNYYWFYYRKSIGFSNFFIFHNTNIEEYTWKYPSILCIELSLIYICRRFYWSLTFVAFWTLLIKKPRGRPKKIEILPKKKDIPKETLVVKRPRGRPKKMEIFEVKRPRGRPKKIEILLIEKKPRGRPKKKKTLLEQKFKVKFKKIV